MEPLGQESLCPDQTAVFECHTPEQSTSLFWTLPNGSSGSLSFLTLTKMNDGNGNVKNTTSDGKFSATLTRKRLGNFTKCASNLTVQPPLNGLNGTTVKCSDSSDAVLEENKIYISGK